MNLFIGKGNLTRDPELRYIESGTAVANCAIAMNRKWKDSEGEMQEEVTFLDFTAWGNRAELLAEYFAKGDPILIKGYLKTETWEDKKTDEKRYKIVCNVDQIEFCGDTSGDGKKKSKGKSRRNDDEDRRNRKDRGRDKERDSDRDSDKGRQSRKPEPEEDADVPF